MLPIVLVETPTISFSYRPDAEDTFKTKVTVDITSDTKQRESFMNNLFMSQVKETHKVSSIKLLLVVI